MDRLPAELICQISTLCSSPTQFQLRHVSRSLRDAVTPSAFEDFYVGWIPKHFRYLKKLAASPLAEHVRRLIINTEMLPILQRDAWEDCLGETGRDWECGEIPDEHHQDNEICGDCGRRWGTHDSKRGDPYESVSHMLSCKYSKRIVDPDWQDFSSLSRDQQLRTPWMGRVFAVALTGLRNIRRLELIDRRGVHPGMFDGIDSARDPLAFIDRRGVHPGMSDGIDSALDPLASCSPWRNTLVNADEYEHVMWRQNDYDGNPRFEGKNVTSAYPLLHIVKAATDRFRNEGPGSLTELRIDTGHHVPLSKVAKRALFPCHLKKISLRTLSEHTPAWLESLSRIDLSPGSEWFQNRELVAEEIVLALSKAKNLRHLVLDLRRADDREVLDLLMGLEQSPWPQLAHLRYSGAIPSYTLLEFLELFAPALRILDLIEVELGYPGTDTALARWDDTIHELRAKLHLEHACVRSLQLVQRPYNVTFFASGSRSAMSRLVGSFLTKREEHLPRQEDWDFVATGTRYAPPLEPNEEQLNTLRDFWAGLVETTTGKLKESNVPR